LRSVLEIVPTTNYGFASMGERSDQMESFSRLLMGLSHGVQLLGQARETAVVYDWPNPPRIERRWLAVVTADDDTTLEWRTRTLASAFEGVGLRVLSGGLPDTYPFPSLGSDQRPHSENLLATEYRAEKDEYTASVLEGVMRHRRLASDQQADIAALISAVDACPTHPTGLHTAPVRVQFNIQHNYVLAGLEYCATLVLRRWPREVAPGWLGQALGTDLPIDVGIHLEPQDSRRVARFLRRQQSWQSDQDSARPDAANALGRRDAEVTRQKLIAGTDRPCKVAIAFTVRASSREELARRVETVKHELGMTLADVREATFEHDRGLEATSPTGKCDLLGAYRTLDCTSVASTGIFQPATVNHANGADLGTTHTGSMLVRLDPFDPSLESFGGIICGKVGSGKSFLLKLLARRLKGVEVLIVEQRTPAEYTGIDGAQSINLADVPYTERAAHLRDFVSRLWETAKADPKPRLLVLDELWSLIKDRQLADLIEEIARIGRHYYLSLLIATQQVRELLDSGRAVLDNAAMRIYLKQHDRDLDDLCDAVGLSTPARRFLRGAGRGQALLDVGGLLVPVDIQASPAEHLAVTTDPREIHPPIGVDTRQGNAFPTGSSSTESESGHLAASRHP